MTAVLIATVWVVPTVLAALAAGFLAWPELPLARRTGIDPIKT